MPQRATYRFASFVTAGVLPLPVLKREAKAGHRLALFDYTNLESMHMLLPYLGYALRQNNRPNVYDPAIDACEITFDRADDRLRTEHYLQDVHLPYVSVHALELSPCGVELPDRNYLRALREIALQHDAASISDHLGLVRDVDTGAEMRQFAPPPWTEAVLDVTCRNVNLIQNYLEPLPFFVESVAYLFRPQGEMSEAEFVSRLLTRTGCGWLLDVTNVYANSLNFQFDPYEFMAEVIPSAHRVQLRLAGGYFDEDAGMYIDSHLHAIPDAVWELYRFALQQGRGKIDAVFVEGEHNFADDESAIDELRHARRIAEATYRPFVRV